jgi:hypothetical protein
MSAAKSKNTVEVYNINGKLVNCFPNAVITVKWLNIHKTTVGRYIKSQKLYDNKYYFKLVSKK